MKANQAALEVGQLAWDMARGYLAHIAAIRMAPRLRPSKDKRGFDLISDALPFSRL